MLVFKNIKGDLEKMIPNLMHYSTEARNIEDLLQQKGLLHTARCEKCNNVCSFEYDDLIIEEDPRRSLLILPYEFTPLQGYITCPWCGNKMRVAEFAIRGQQMYLERKWWTDIGTERRNNQKDKKNVRNLIYLDNIKNEREGNYYGDTSKEMRDE